MAQRGLPLHGDWYRHDAEIWKNGWIWEFGMKIRVETRFEKQTVWTCQLFPKNIKENTGLDIWNRFGTYLAFQIFGYFGVWTKK